MSDARRHVIKVKLHKDERKALKKLARKKGISVSALVRKFLYDTFPPLKW